MQGTIAKIDDLFSYYLIFENIMETDEIFIDKSRLNRKDNEGRNSLIIWQKTGHQSIESNYE